MDVLHEIDEKLKELKEAKEEFEKLKREAQAEIERVKAAYSPRLSQLDERIKSLDESIKKLLKSNKSKLFKGSDMLELNHGSVFYRVRIVVHRARGVLDRLRELGLKEAIKVVEHVRWDVIEGWDDEKLELIGTRRKKKESFEYELK